LVEAYGLRAGAAAAGPAAQDGLVAGAAPPAAVSGRPLGFWVEPFEREEGVRAGDERAVVMKARVASFSVVVEGVYRIADPRRSRAFYEAGGFVRNR